MSLTKTYNNDYNNNMKQTINFNQFCDGFGDTYKNNFTYEGKRALFEYLEHYEDETDTQMEYDPIAFCCEFTEYNNFKEYQEQYGDRVKNIEKLSDHTQVIPIKGTNRFIIQQY